ncbi:MAG: BACON domain-containing protein [Alistipes sp.]|nr:BACON domain-containing protein [Alistipes sp.]
MKKLFAFLLALPLFMVSCNENTEDGGGSFIPPKPEEESLELTSEANMSFEAKGGNGEITYNLVRNDITAGEDMDITEPTSPITVGASVEWITILDEESSYGIIKFSVAENTATKERTGLIIGSYNKKSFTVTINQAAAEPIVTPTIEGWAVVGSMTNNWDAASGIKMESIEGYYVARGVEVGASDSFKFVKDGSLQNALGGNGQVAERDYKYPTMKYGSDIHVKEAGVYDLYINEAADNYYVMSEGKHPSEANEILAPGEDAWYVTGLGESQRMRAYGLYMVLSDVSIDEEGFKLYHSLTNKNYGAATDATAELGDEIAIVADSENKIKANIEADKTYDIYLNVEQSKVWVMPRNSKPDVVIECDYAEGVWFTNKNFMVMIKGNGLRITLDCDSAVAHEDAIIPAATYSVGGEDGYIINVNSCEIANEDGKQPVINGSITISHIDDGYEIYVDVTNPLQRRIRAHYRGYVSSNTYMGGAITNPKANN